MRSDQHTFENENSNPVLIFGTGRCGTTIFYRILASHPETVFVSNLNLKFPDRVFPHKLNYIAGKFLLRKGIVSPSEAYPILNRIYPGYRRPIRNLESFDVNKEVKEGFRSLFRELVRKQGGSQVLYKYTGWSRIGFFKEIFPKATFIHVVRDGRAVANSMTNVDWWDGYQGPQNWRWGELPFEYREEWEQNERSFLVLAAIEWKMLLDEYENSLDILEDNRKILIKYEDLVENPKACLKKVTEKTNLDWSDRFVRRVEEYDLYNANDKWKENLKEIEKKRLNKVLQNRLEKYGYTVST